MEDFNDYLIRTKYQHDGLKLGEGDFIPDPDRLCPKVDENNCFKPYYGDTVIFDLEPKDADYFASVRDELYSAAPECFAPKLPAETMHMTLHDLSSGENKAFIGSLCDENAAKLGHMKERSLFSAEPVFIRMKAHYIINMVKTSVVYTLAPECEDDWNKLEGLYRMIDAVRVCPYSFLTPHITLGYYNRCGFDADSARKLTEAAAMLNAYEKPAVVLSTERLFYKRFISMTEYDPLFGLQCKL